MMETLHVEQLAAPSSSSFEALPALADLFGTTQHFKLRQEQARQPRVWDDGGPTYVLYISLSLDVAYYVDTIPP